jgi:hypothetical protein
MEREREMEMDATNSSDAGHVASDPFIVSARIAF